MDGFPDPAGAPLILSDATHTGAFDCHNTDSEVRVHGPSPEIESLFQSREVELSHMITMYAGIRDVVEVSSVVR